MPLIINALLALLFFLTLFGLSFWPLLFRAKPYRNIMYVGSNIICVIMLLAFFSAPAKARRQNERTASDFHQSLACAAELLDSGKELEPPLPALDAKTADAAHEQLARWSDALRANYRKTGEQAAAPVLPEPGREVEK